MSPVGLSRLAPLARVALGLSPWAPAPRPDRGAAVTAAWLTEVFARRAPGAAVERVDVVDATAGTTDRARLAVTWNAAGTAAGLPARVFVKSTPSSARNRAMVAALDMAINEVRFYRTARPDLGDGLAPALHAGHAGPGARHLLLLEDVVAAGGWPYALADDCDLAHAEGIMAALGRLHATYWNSARFAGDLAWVVPQSQRPGMGLLRRTFRYVRKKLAKSTKHDLPAPVRRLAEFVNAHDEALYRRWERPPLTLTHGDCHLGNTYRLPGGGAGLLDWQVVHRAPGLQEVAYFLTHSVPTELRRAHERPLLALYLETLAKHGVAEPPPIDEAFEDYRFFAFDAWDSSAITVLWPGLQSPENVAASFARANATVVDLAVDDAVRRAFQEMS